jgi:hypothetical protein
MLNLNESRFGKPISLKNTGGTLGANAMISQFINVKKNNKKRLCSIFEGDNHAYRYFCNDDCAYIFDVKILEAIVSAIKIHGGDEGGCVVLFQGLRKDEVNKGNKKDCHFGRPTLIATAYKNTGESLERVQIPWSFGTSKKNNSDDVDGFEHPGDGTGGTNPFTGASIENDVTWPVVHPSNADSDTDFEINDTITNLDGWI